MIYPSVVKNYKVYNAAGGQFVGLADIVLPKLTFEKNDLKGAGLAGSMNLPVEGNVTPMTTTLTFHTQTLQSLALFNGSTAQIRCLSSLQVFDTSKGQFSELPEEVLMTVCSDESDLGKRDASTKAMTILTFSVIYLALFFNSQKFWEIDPFSNICIISGVDLNSQTRSNIGG
jgi:P2 family phage contractile tail tube protein